MTAKEPPKRLVPRYRPTPAPRRPEPSAPAGLNDPRVLQGFATLRAERVFAEAQDCAACTAARAAETREDALCDAHMGQALGIDGGWDLGAPGRRLK